MPRLAPFLVVLIVAGGAPAGAQDERAAGAERPPRGEAFRMVDAYVMSNLQESLGLTDAEFERAVPLVRRLQTSRRDYFLQRARTVREMRRRLHEGGATEAQVLELLRRLKALDAEGPAEVQKGLEALDAALTPLQQAKFRVLELEVEQRMREIVSRAGPRSRSRAPRE